MSECDINAEISMAFAQSFAEAEDDIFMQRSRWHIRARSLGRTIKRFGWKVKNIFG